VCVCVCVCVCLEEEEVRILLINIVYEKRNIVWKVGQFRGRQCGRGRAS
jgi:hypothetical protein